MAEIESTNVVDRIVNFFVANEGKWSKPYEPRLDNFGKVNVIESIGDKITTLAMANRSRI